MAVTTIRGRDILLKMAEDLDQIKSAYVTSNGSTVSVTCASVTVAANTYQYALGRILGKGDCTISSHTAAGVFTVATLDSAPAINDVFQWAWWTGNKVGDAVSAMNEAIRYSWPYFYREKKTGTNLTGTVAKAGSTTLTGTSTLFLSELSVGDHVSVPGGGGTEIRTVSAIASNTSLTVSAAFANTATGQTASLVSNITLAAGTHVHALPTSCSALIAIGVQPLATQPIEWLTWGDEASSYWTVEGQLGAYVLRLNPRYSRAGAISDAYDAETLHLWYATREPALTDLTTSTCQLPLDYFTIASATYSIRQLNTASRVDLIAANVSVPQLQERAREALQVLGVGKRPPNQVVSPLATFSAEQMQRVSIEQGDSSERKRFVMGSTGSK